MDLEYPIIKHPTEFGLGDYEMGNLPVAFLDTLIDIRGLDYYNAYDGNESPQVVAKRVQEVLEIFRGPFGGLEDFKPTASLLFLNTLEDLENQPSEGKERFLELILTLTNLCLKDLETLDERVFDIAHESEMLIMQNTVLDHFYFTKEEDIVLGQFTLKSSNEKYPINLFFEFLGSLSTSDIEFEVTAHLS